jgi:pyrimidine operon attenuation protein / uracil phosphoribosyltransferase
MTSTETKSENLILDPKQIRQKIRRIAYQIYENNLEEKEIVLAGVRDNGLIIARLLADELHRISPLLIRLVSIRLDKFAPLQSEIALDCETEVLENKAIILVDDVMHTGRTLAYSLRPFLNIRIKTLQTAVLVDRGHTTFPISCDYTGYSLSTTIQQHIEVILEEEKMGVYLF